MRRSEECQEQVLHEQDMIKKELPTMQAAIENLQQDILQTERDIEKQGQRGCSSHLWVGDDLRGCVA